MPCSQVDVDWPIPWVQYDQNTAQSFDCGSKRYIPLGGWEVGARPPTITLSLNASVAFPTQEFSIYDTAGAVIGTSPTGVSAGVSTKIITLVFGSFDMDYLYANYVGPATDSLLITAVDGVSLPVFWQNFHGQHETT